MLDRHRAAQADNIFGRIGPRHAFPARVVLPIEPDLFSGGKCCFHERPSLSGGLECCSRTLVTKNQFDKLNVSMMIFNTVKYSITSYARWKISHEWEAKKRFAAEITAFDAAVLLQGKPQSAASRVLLRGQIRHRGTRC